MKSYSIYVRMPSEFVIFQVRKKSRPTKSEASERLSRSNVQKQFFLLTSIPVNTNQLNVF